MDKHREFDAYAKSYEELLADPLRDSFVKNSEFFHRRKWDLLKSFARRNAINMANVDWLDVGCGKGELLRYGQGKFHSITGCDPSAGMLADCEGLNVVQQDDLAKLPFPDQSFDWVTAVCVFHHIPPAARLNFTQEMVRVLRRGGYCMFVEHNPWNPATRLIVKRTPIDADAILLSGQESLDLHRHAGMINRELRYFLFFPEKLHEKLTSLEDRINWVPLGGQYIAVSQKHTA
jgi:SAM-dependent methyltransferase